MNMSVKICALCAVLFSGLANRPALGQSLAELEARLTEHPSVNALTYQAEASRERSISATALPDPEVSLAINNFPIFDPSFSDFLPTNKAVGIRQAIPNRAGRLAQAGEARASADQTLRIRAAQLATLRAELIALLHEKARIAHQRELAGERETKYDELTEIVEAEIDAGRPAVYRLAEIEAERTGVARSLIDLARQETETDAGLIDLLGEVPATPAPPIAPADWSGDAQAFHAVRVADAGVRLGDHAVDKAKSNWRANWGAQLTYQQRDAGPGFAGDDWVSGMVTFSVPLWAKNSQEPRLRAARAERASAEMRYQAAARRSAARFAAEAAAWRAAEGNIAVLSRNIAAVEDEIAAQLTVYESGQGDYAPIIDGELAILKLRADIAGEESRRAAAIARMNALLVTS